MHLILCCQLLSASDGSFHFTVIFSLKKPHMRQKTGGEEMDTKKPNRKIILGAAALIVAVAVFLVIFNVFREKPVAGSKAVTLEVLNQEQETSKYSVQTDAEFLRQVMEEAENFTFDGEEGEYGFTLYTVNGETHNWNVDGSYWAVYVNGEYGQYGIDSQPVEDGDVFRFEYTPPYSE